MAVTDATKVPAKETTRAENSLAKRKFFSETSPGSNWVEWRECDDPTKPGDHIVEGAEKCGKNQRNITSHCGTDDVSA